MLTPGTSALEPGSLAALIFDNLAEEFGDEFGLPPPAAAPAWAGLASALARAVVTHLTANAEITVSVTPGDGSLQRYDPGGGAVPTLPPTSTQTLEGTIA